MAALKIFDKERINSRFAAKPRDKFHTRMFARAGVNKDCVSVIHTHASRAHAERVKMMHRARGQKRRAPGHGAG